MIADVRRHLERVPQPNEEQRPADLEFMDPQLRARFNADFTPEKYAALLRCVNESEKWPADFRIAETPIFLTRKFRDEVVRGAKAIVDLYAHAGIRAPRRHRPFRRGLDVPNEPAHPNFLVVDFGICAERDRLVPRLIELQAFPKSLRISVARSCAASERLSQ